MAGILERMPEASIARELQEDEPDGEQAGEEAGCEQTRRHAADDARDTSRQLADHPRSRSGHSTASCTRRLPHIDAATEVVDIEREVDRRERREFSCNECIQQSTLADPAAHRDITGVPRGERTCSRGAEML